MARMAAVIIRRRSIALIDRSPCFHIPLHGPGQARNITFAPDPPSSPSTSADSAYQKSLRALIGKVLPDARAPHIAEAVAASYGYRTHKAFGAAIRAVEAGRSAPAPDFDADRLTDRLHELGEDVRGQDQALRFPTGSWRTARGPALQPSRTRPTRPWHGSACTPGLRSPKQASGGTPARSSARFLRSADGWLMPLVTPLQKGA